MSEKIVIFGYGAAGQAVATRFAAAGRRVIVAQRSEPDGLAAGVDFVHADVLKEGDVLVATQGASHAVIATGFAYSTAAWAENWPRAMNNFITAARQTGARTLFFDNLYMYGPQSAPISETSAFTPWGGKPAVRRQITDMWQSASARGDILMTALRVPDFYGPGVHNSHLGELVFGRLASGRPAQLAVPCDLPHDFAYVPDVARAVEALIDASDDVFGQVWHMPCAPTRTIRDIIEIGAKAISKKARIQTVPLWLAPILGIFSPMLREVYDVRFLFDRPYHVDASKFRNRFWSDVTPFETGLSATARSYLRVGKM